MRSIAFVILVLFVLAGAIYSPVRHFGFVEYDDPEYITKNVHVQAGFTVESIHYAFTVGDVGSWNPLVWLSFYLDRSLFHLNSGPMHVENVALHLLAAIILFFVLMEATGAKWRSGMVAALFLCHPMHVESVAWISERKDVLSVPLLFAAIGAYIRYTRAAIGSRRTLWYLLVIVFFILSLMAKPMGVTFPAVLFLLDYWPLRRVSTGRLIFEKIPLIAISLIAVVLAIFAQQTIGATSSLSVLPFFFRIENALLAYVEYIAKLFVPINLAVFYPHPESIGLLQAAASGVLLIIVTVAAFQWRGRRPYLWVGWLWFIGTLVPVIGLVQIGAQAMADRFTYFPSVGLFIIIAWGACDLATALIASARFREGMLAFGATVVIVLMVVISWQQVMYWQSTESLFSHAEAVTDDNWVAHLELGKVASDRGDIISAANEYAEVIRLQPRNPKGYNNLAECILHTSPADAIPLYEKAVQYAPRVAYYRLNLAAALVMTGQREAALEQAREALRLRPDLPAARAAVADLTTQNQSPSRH